MLALIAVVAALAVPPSPGFVALRDVDPTILQDIRYATPHNFTGAPVPGYREPQCLLAGPAARALRRAQATLLPRGLSLKVYDCYRPRRAVARFVAWARSPGEQSMKGEFYPRVDKRRLIAEGYLAERSGHSRGATVDLTIVRLPARPARAYRPGERACYAPGRFPDGSIDMGTGFDCFDPLAHTRAAGGQQLRNRLLLKQTMENAGFTGLATEWWHFTYRREPFPGTYFDFPVTGSSALISRTSSSALSRASSSARRPSGVIR
jgi:zinc D-Ala-D-Ala dipeptidase